jgi:hypothetical protein
MVTMPRGGARNRSGPQKVEGSRTSERAGYVLTALPPIGFDGDAPEFPLPRRDVFRKEWDEAGKQVQVYDDAETKRVAERESELWSWLWSLPQACAWSMPSESWRGHTIALYARTFVICESGDATAADKGSLHRFADQIGMTPAGLRENGWKIAEVGAAPVDATGPESDEDEDDPRNRLTVVPDVEAG